MTNQGRRGNRKQKYRDHTGERYGRLLALRFSRISDTKKTYWWFVCDCGQETETRIDQVRSGSILSCGCWQKEATRRVGIATNGMPYKPKIDLVSHRFGRLTVIAEAERLPNTKERRWLCRCDCGGEVISPQQNLTGGKTNSCGCLHREKATLQAILIGHANLQHGMTKTAEWLAWKNMHGRCSDPGQRSYYRYGGRGIKVCQRWEDFMSFYADIGNRPSDKHSLGRINNDGDYCPENCRWETGTEQQRNRSNNRRLNLDGITKCLVEWSEGAGLTVSQLHMRLKYGWPLDLAITTPVGVRPPELAERRLPVDPVVRLKAHAYQVVCQAVKKGILVRPDFCTVAGCNGSPVEGYHHYGYEKEHWLDVTWLCRKHREQAVNN